MEVGLKPGSYDDTIEKVRVMRFHRGTDYMCYFTAFLKRSPLLILFFCLLLAGCEVRERTKTERTTTIVFKHGKIAGDPILFRALLDEFEKKTPGIKVRDETLPASSDEQHQFYIINLEGGSADFDVISMDVIWVPEFARAGWLRDLSRLLPEEERGEFFPGPIESVIFEGKVYAVPWYIDAGLLYYRKDLLSKYGFSPPQTWQDLVRIAQHIISKERNIYGFIWQGRQYEGLVCNVMEYLWSNGGGIFEGEGVVVDSPRNIEALTFMRDLITKYGITPQLVTTAIEEPTRHIFGSGRALFMRNWPYAWNIFEQKDSVIRGKVGVSALPHFGAEGSASTLGGWQLGVNRNSRNAEAAEKLVLFLTSPEIQKKLALSIGYKPTRKSLYEDPELLQKQPFMTGLFEVFMSARPRPVSPYYIMISQVLQPEFSAAIAGIKTPEDALRSAQEQIVHILKAEE
jgi:multiple sugar transport system substrate-binding protein